MKTHYNDPEYAKKMAQKFTGLTSFPPAIPFDKPTEKKVEKDKENKDKFKSFDIKIDKEDKDSDKIEHNVRIFEEGSPETYIKWLESYQELKQTMPLDKPEHQVNVIRSILKGSYLETFNNTLGNTALTDKKVNDALAKVTLKVFSNDRHAYRRQVQYMRYQLYFTTTNFKHFEHRLKQLNKYLEFFPIPPGKRDVKSLPEDQLIEIIDNSKPLEYHQQMLQNNYDPYDKSMEEFSQYLERLEASHKIGTAIHKANKGTNSSIPTKRKRKERTEKAENKLHKCKYCKKMVTHEPQDCWEKPGNEDNKPNWMKKRKFTKHPQENKKGSPSFTSEQVNFLIQRAKEAAGTKPKKVKKRQVTYKEQSESESDVHEESHCINLADTLSEDSLSDSMVS